MKQKLRLKVLTLSASAACLLSLNIAVAQTTQSYDFNAANDLTDNFNLNTAESSHVNIISTEGIEGTGSLKRAVTNNKTNVSKTGMALTENNTYIISGYFQIGFNGYGGLGFATTNTGITTDAWGQVNGGLGFGFHGGGGRYFEKVGGPAPLDEMPWGSDLVQDNWYYIEMTLATSAVDHNYSVTFEIYNSDAAGVVGTIFESASVVRPNNTNSNFNLGSSTIYPYMSFTNTRITHVDDFKVQSTNPVSSVLYDFNSAGSLDTDFNVFPEAAVVVSSATNALSGGISDSGAVNRISTSGDTNWTAKAGLPFVLNNTYTVAGYFQIDGNNRGGIGFSVSNINQADAGYARSSGSIVNTFHGGGGEFNSNVGTAGNLDQAWGDGESTGDLQSDSWYYIVLTITTTGSSTDFASTFEIYNSDAAGNIGALFSPSAGSDASYAYSAFTNDKFVPGATTIYPYFSFNGIRVKNVDNFSISSDTTLGVNEHVFNEVTLYPNPSNGDVFLTNLGVIENATVRVSNIMGQLVKEVKGITSNNQKLTIEGGAGIYFVQVATDNAHKTYKVIKK